MTTCLVVQHAEPEGPYGIGAALEAAGVDLEIRPLHAGAPLPPHLGQFEGLVVMGGPMSAGSDEGFPTRSGEVALLAEAVALGVPTLGVCLGAQLLAVAAGGRVTAGADGLEVGWGPVQLTPAARHDPLLGGLPAELTVLHWHGETFDLPRDAQLLASNDRYRHQAFRVGEAAWGLQFHVEADEDVVRAFLEGFPDDVAAAGRTPEEVLAATAGAVHRLAPHRGVILDRFAGMVASRRRTSVRQLTDRR
ncbi:MAG TPA: type 1 glutamine amidotransferase [Acidimicrobiales bacterium]|nr:type 1 glutamine amidotransferase [Acidimicrobiales bacterium]